MDNVVKRPAIFLDRDGVMIVDKDFQIEESEIEFFPGVFDALKAIGRKFLKVVVSNQSGIARKKFTEDEVERFNHELSKKLKSKGITVNGWYYCPHSPEDNCQCRKPKPGMLLKAADELSVELAESWMIGDKSSDIVAGQVAGVQTILVKTGYAGNEYDSVPVKPDHIADNLYDAVKLINGSLT